MRDSSAGLHSPPPTRRQDRFLPVAAAIFLVSLTIRLVHLFQIRRAPFFALLMGDAQSYH
ncbi:MAG: hypothetical protein HY047_14435, partial [Acidobacteria bacterium]|nr:hypothetical protein [Acidobacteriota bacterium]